MGVNLYTQVSRHFSNLIVVDEAEYFPLRGVSKEPSFIGVAQLELSSFHENHSELSW